MGLLTRDVDRIHHLPVDQIFQNPYQPRRVFRKDALDQLKLSIQQHGVLNPVIVRTADRGYELACGERRLRACRELGHATIPALVRNLTTPQMVEMALVENLMRKDLILIEEAETFERMCMEFEKESPDELARRLGIPREKIDRYARLTKLPMLLKKAIYTELITEDEAEALAALKDEGAMARGIAERVAAKNR